jgi:hypothetical protein
MNDDDLWQIERAARHLSAAMDSYEGIPQTRMTRGVRAQFKRMQEAEYQLMRIRDRLMRDLGISIEEVEGWDTP